jgi:hypothetical protein
LTHAEIYGNMLVSGGSNEAAKTSGRKRHERVESNAQDQRDPDTCELDPATATGTGFGDVQEASNRSID